MTRHRWLLGIILLLCHCITVSHSASGDDSGKYTFLNPKTKLESWEIRTIDFTDASYSFGSFFYDAKDWLSQKVNAVISTTSNAMLWLQEKYSSSSCYFDLFDPKLLTGVCIVLNIGKPFGQTTFFILPIFFFFFRLTTQTLSRIFKQLSKRETKKNWLLPLVNWWI